MYWANFLHIYQPPTQTDEIVNQVARECYRPLVEILQAHPHGRLTLNINACLTEHLDRCGHGDILEGLKALAEQGQIEFTGSAKYHPILPLIPPTEMERQIELNEATNRAYFGEAYRPEGFFPPEMCYSRAVAEAVAKLGYRWIIVDEIAYSGRLGAPPTDRCFTIAGLGPFGVFFKERRVSTGITFGSCETLEALRRFLAEAPPVEGYLLSGTDGEVYGHHRPGQERLLQEAFGDPEVTTVTLSDLVDRFADREEVDPLDSSWSAWEDEMDQGLPFPQWRDPSNPIHELQWQLAGLAIEALEASSDASPGGLTARQLLDEGLHSCQWWWASCRPWWDTGMVDKGAAVLAEAVKHLEGTVASTLLDQAESLRERIHLAAKAWHEEGEAARRQQAYREAHQEVSSLLS
ncbi:MAG: hypothetical protein ACE5H5_03340, partial [Nitrospinota bacterium]